MAKRKRAAHEKPFERSAQPTDAEAATETAVADVTSEVTSGVADRFVGQWNQLISTTNWEKGQIICEWRDALMADGSDVTAYSDEAWAQLVGGVTSQHVGRLRRVYQRFGDVSGQYGGLYWSHFQACLDWDDAEMWLEGSIQNNWSVSQMRGKRWETVGATPEQQSAEVEQLAAEQASEAAAEESQAQSAAEDQDAPFDVEEAKSSTTEVSSLGESSAESCGESAGDDSDSSETTSAAEPVEKRTRLNVDVESLPDDLAEAFESFKLAIIAHRREDWRDTKPESVVECLNALKELVMAE